MTYDGTMDIALGLTAKSKTWKNQQMTWSALVARLQDTKRTGETLREFLSASKEEQSKIKDVGGYVGGYLRGGRRKSDSVVHRQLLTLDIDFGNLDIWENLTMLYGNAAVMHATHKHSAANPRFRLIMPLQREVTPDEYVAIGRRIAGDIGIELFDNSTFEPERLMFWPSSPKDGDYYFRLQDGPWVDPDEVLARYTDWRDTSLWPTADAQIAQVRDAAAKQEDPTEKKGVVGAFCRAYNIRTAISSFLQDIYTGTSDPDRYTYTKGSTACGLIVYDDRFAYSHHGTDPCGGKLCNAFDLVRIHKFGYLDDDQASGYGVNSKSYKAMEDFVRQDRQVLGIIAEEKMESARQAFAAASMEQEEEPQDSLEWMKDLEADRSGKYISNARNLNLIFQKDKKLAGAFGHNDFDNRDYVFRSVPWRRIQEREPVRNVDYAGIHNYIEVVYGITGVQKIDDALALSLERNHYHPVREYLDNLSWDGRMRINDLLSDFFGAPRNEYSSAAMRKMLAAAVARIYEPGTKFDLVLTLVGPQGTGKSTFIKRLGRQWFSDTFLTVQGKEALEQIQGAWLIEIAELSGFRKAEVESVKHFISKQVDTFRAAYARTAESYPRQCVFFGTTNNKDFLRDPSGNRRFMPVDIHPDMVTRDVFDELTPAEVDQIWAEAVVLYRAGEQLYLNGDAQMLATQQQLDHVEIDERQGLIEQFLETPIAEWWDTLDIPSRRMWYYSDDLPPKGVRRETVCVAELWCECFGREKIDMDKYKTRELNDIMRGLKGWRAANGTKNFPNYGKQRYYVRIRE